MVSQPNSRTARSRPDTPIAAARARSRIGAEGVLAVKDTQFAMNSFGTVKTSTIVTITITRQKTITKATTARIAIAIIAFESD